MEVEENDPELYRSTAEKIERKHKKIITELKSKNDRKDMPALLPLHIPEVIYRSPWIVEFD